MRELSIEFKQGPMAGEFSRFDIGQLLIGREPRPEPGQLSLVLRGAESSVSRNHALLEFRNGEVMLVNQGGNGTLVNGKLYTGETALKPGDTIGVGESHEFSVSWELVGQGQATPLPAKTNAAAVASSGPLSSPLVRAVLVVYLGVILAVAAWFGLKGEGHDILRDDWPALSEAYAEYQPPGADAAQKQRRTQLAQAAMVRLRVLRANERHNDVKRLCRELMRLDSDIASPLYRYGARCLGETD